MLKNQTLKHRFILKAVRASSASGALKVSVQILVALLVYPAIISQGGPGALGAWVMLQIIIGYGGLVHLGMAPVITKQVSSLSMSGNVLPIATSLSEALSGAFFVACTLTIVVAIFFYPIAGIIQRGIEPSISPVTLWVMLVGVIIRLLSALYGSVVAGYQRIYQVHISQFLQLVIFTVVFFVVSVDGDILFVLATAFTIGYVAEFAFVLVVLFRLNPSFINVHPTLSITKLRRFLRTVMPYFMVETGLLGREPLLKYAIFLCCGSVSVGIFELASKIPASIRQAFVYGLGALMPAFAKLDGDGAPSNIIRLGQDALRYIFFGAIGALFLYLLNANQLLNLWLGSTNDELLIMTILMTFWWMATSVNVPAWWLGIGIGSVWPNTLIAGFHFILALGLVCLTWIISFDSLTLVFLWVICGIGMQILLYTLMEWKTKMIKSMYLSREMALVFTAFITVTGMTFLCHFWLRRVFFSPATVLISSVLFFYLQVIALMLIIRLREGR